MSGIVTHTGTRWFWTAFKEGDNSWTVTFLNGANPFDISSLTFRLKIRRTEGGADILTLDEGSGLTNGGASGVLTIDLTLDDIEANLPADNYFYILEYDLAVKTFPLYQGLLSLTVDNPASTTTETTVTVNIGGENITANVILFSALGNSDIDGGAASTVYNSSQNIDGGTA